MKRERRTGPSQRVQLARASEGRIHHKLRDQSAPGAGPNWKIHKQIANQGELLDLPSRALVIEEGQQAREIFLVESGGVMLSKALRNDRRQVVGFRFPGDLITLRGAGQAWAVTAHAMVPSRVRRVPWETLNRLLKSDPSLSCWLFDRAGDEIAATQGQLLTVGRRNKEERLAAFILEIWRRTEGRPSRPPEVVLAMHRLEIADYLGLTTETISRVLSQFARDGLIALPHPSRIKLLSPALLEDLAEGRRPQDRRTERTAHSTP